jgi:hypothetical protein
MVKHLKEGFSYHIQLKMNAKMAKKWKQKQIFGEEKYSRGRFKVHSYTQNVAMCVQIVCNP